MGVPQHRLFSASSSAHTFFKEDPQSTMNNNYIRSSDVTINSISEFYNNSKIFITGATGFVGKALVEKLLQTCDGIDSIYLLMRPKKGMAIEQRLKELAKNPVFNRVIEKNPDCFEKVKVISGDVSLPNLGMTNSDKQFILDNVEIVFHSAATVKFNEDLRNAVILNTLGTKRVLQICEEMKKLKSFVHVSTAYSNSDKETIEEMIYKPPYDPNSIINCVEMLPEDALTILSDKLLGKHPNTYTFTKAMAEYLVLEYSGIIPAAIVRPSIITAAWKDPYPGWVDNVSGITGIFMECGRGTIKTIICDDKCVMDLIPVDIVVNTLITAAWHTEAYRSNSMRVYNCTSGNTNPVTWKQFGELTHKWSMAYPSKYVTWYPGFTYRTSRTIHTICAVLYHFIPSLLLDMYLYAIGKKPMMFKISKKFYSALEAGSFFSTNQWDFKTTNMVSLVEAVQLADDGKMFNVDVSEQAGFHWDQYVKDFIVGVRQYILKDDLSSLPRARTKLNRLYWFQKIVQIVTMYTIFRLTASYLE